MVVNIHENQCGDQMRGESHAFVQHGMTLIDELIDFLPPSKAGEFICILDPNSSFFRQSCLLQK